MNRDDFENLYEFLENLYAEGVPTEYWYSLLKIMEFVEEVLN